LETPRVQERAKRKPISITKIAPLSPVPSDITIAQTASRKGIAELAAEVGILPEELELYGEHKAKVRLSVLKRLQDQPLGRYVVVTAVTPTPLGEGKTTTTIGLSQALGAHLGKRVFTCIRQPSMGPTFGIKGGAAGGGYSQVLPMEDFNLHLTGDIHAIAAANNLLAAAIDSRMLYERDHPADDQLAQAFCKKDSTGQRQFAAHHLRRLQRLGLKAATPEDLNGGAKRALFRLDIEPRSITWNRVVDINDRMLRLTRVGMGVEEGMHRETGFDIAVASEVMAIVALSRDLADMRERLQRIVIGLSRRGDPVTADDLGVAGAMAVLLKDTIKPTLLQTLEGTPVFVHAGPFANIAHGNSSIVADQIALRLADYVVTEAGFGSDIGFEKFADIKCRTSGLKPDCAVLVVTIRALKMHGGGPKVAPGKPLDTAYSGENLGLIEAGIPNLVRHIEIVKKFGVPVVVAINRFSTDAESEIELVRLHALKAGAEAAVPSSHWSHGGAGAEFLAEAVVDACERGGSFQLLYPAELGIKEKIERIAKLYGASGVDYSPEAEQRIKQFTDLGYSEFPICMAKTHLSFTDNPELKNAPSGFRLTVREVRASVGAGFIYPVLGAMRTMPALPPRPAFVDVDIDPVTERIQGLF
jgi:formyltetrahydrofolate synthetase